MGADKLRILNETSPKSPPFLPTLHSLAAVVDWVVIYFRLEPLLCSAYVSECNPIGRHGDLLK